MELLEKFMRDTNSIDTVVRKTVGKIKIRRFDPKVEGCNLNYYRCTWDGKFTMDGKAQFKSPLFTIPNRNNCKWYLSVQPQRVFHGSDKDVFYLSTRLYLDRKSKCKSVFTQFTLQVDDRKNESVPPSFIRIFEFDKKSENYFDDVSKIPSKELQRYYDSDDEDDEKVEYFGITVVCTIIIVSVIPEDDSFLNDFESLMKDKRFADVKIFAGPYRKKFLAHKAILSARSSVFAAMFAHNKKENQDEVVEVNIKEFNRDVVEGMLHYIYTGEVEGYEDLAQELLMTADKYDLKGLKSQCEGVLIESLSSSNVFELALFAESNDASSLKYEAAHFIWRKKRDLMKSPGWKNLGESNSALARKISKCDFHPKPTSDCESDTEESDHSTSVSISNSDVDGESEKMELE